MSFPFDLEPHERDPGGWCASLLHNAEFLLGCLNAVQARSVAEVGAFMGELTRLLLRWSDEVDGRVLAIDPSPHADLEQLEQSTDSRRVRDWDPRAQPSEPILFPRLRIHFADFPCLHCSIDQRLFTLET